MHKRILSAKDEVSEKSLTKVIYISMPHNEKIADFSINLFHGVALTDQGKVYT